MDPNTQEPKPTEGQEPSTPEPSAAEPTSDPFKGSKAYKAMASQIAELRREKQEREAAEEKSRKEAELKELEAKGEYENITKSLKSEIEQLKSKYDSELQKRDLTTELLKAGFNNDLFMAGAVANYNSETFGEISEYVSTLAKDEANAPFLGKDMPARDPKSPPVPSASGSKVNWDQVKAWEHSDNREERIKARQILKKYRDENGKYPY